MIQVFSVLYSALVFSWTAICAVLTILQTRTVAGLPAGAGLLEAFVFCSTAFAYNITASVRWRKAGAVLLAIPLLFFFPFLRFEQQIAISASGLLWLIYLGTSGRSGLRGKPWLKPITVSLAWGFVTVFLPLPFHDWLAAMPVLVGRSTFVFGLALGYDLADRGVDRRLGLRTLAGEIGVQATLRLITVVFVLSGLFGLLNFGLTLAPLRHVAVRWGSLLLSVRLIGWQLRHYGPQQWQKISIDAMLALQALGLILAGA